jgi:DNA topoisomerase-1
MASLFKSMALDTLTVDEARSLLALPRTLGKDPADGEVILANNGRYGPYVQKAKDYRTIESEAQLLTITLPEALVIFASPKQFRRGATGSPSAKGPLRDFGADPTSGKAVLAKEGKFGVYVTDGETNASLTRGDRLEAMLPERAFELLAIRREVVAEKGGPAPKKGRAPKAAAPAKPAKKAAAEKPAKKKEPAKATKKAPKPAEVEVPAAPAVKTVVRRPKGT